MAVNLLGEGARRRARPSGREASGPLGVVGGPRVPVIGSGPKLGRYPQVGQSHPDQRVGRARAPRTRAGCRRASGQRAARPPWAPRSDRTRWSRQPALSSIRAKPRPASSAVTPPAPAAGSGRSSPGQPGVTSARGLAARRRRRRSGSAGSETFTRGVPRRTLSARLARAEVLDGALSGHGQGRPQRGVDGRLPRGGAWRRGTAGSLLVAPRSLSSRARFPRRPGWGGQPRPPQARSRAPSAPTARASAPSGRS